MVNLMNPDDLVPASAPIPADDPLRRQLLAQCNAMGHHAFASGIRIPQDVLEALGTLERAGNTADGSQTPPPLQEIAALHGRLAEIVAPATPRTIYLLHTDPMRDRWLSILGPLPTIRRLVIVAMVFMAMFLGLSLSDLIDTDTVNQSIFTLDGPALLAVLLFIVSLAGLGAGFHALFTAYRYVNEGSYDPKYDSSYWIRIGLGLMAGVLMAELLPIESQDGSFTKPLLALLGGFSAALVYRILTRMVETVESLFKADPRETIANQEKLQRARSKQEIEQNRVEMAAQLIAIRDELAKGADPGQISAALSAVLTTLLPMATSGANPPAAANDTLKMQAEAAE